MTRTLAIIAALGAACGQVKQDQGVDAPAGDPDGAAADHDAASQGRCDPDKPFGAATLVRNVSSTSFEGGFGISADDLTAFVSQSDAQAVRVVTAQRTSVDDDFGALTNGLTSALNAAAGDEYGGSPSADGNVLYFHRQNGASIAVLAATRTSAAAPFSAGAAVRVDGAALSNALAAQISADGNTLYWVDAADLTLRSAARTGGATAFGAAVRVTSFQLASTPVLTADELTMYYSPGTVADDVHVTTRATRADKFFAGVPVPNVSSARGDQPVALTRDGCILYIASDRPGGLGGSDIWEARRPR